MPLLPTRLFVGSDVVQRMVARVNGRMTARGEARLLHIEVTKNLYPVDYVRCVLKANRAVRRDTVDRFHASVAGQRAIAAAKAELEKRLHTPGPYHDAERPHLVTVRALANTFYTEPQTVDEWCANGLLPCGIIDDKYYFDPDQLSRHLAWSL